MVLVENGKIKHLYKYTFAKGEINISPFETMFPKPAAVVI